MSVSNQKVSEVDFLSDGGEMSEIISAYDWEASTLGPIKDWPTSLKSTIGIILHSAFPHFFFWGEDLISFYNDAFRPSLGQDGKHPCIGKPGREVWPEIWDFIGPLIHQVMATGRPVKFEDQLVPFYRNGKIEDIYWTFCYSPAFGDDGKVAGVFVTCTETTEKVISMKTLQASENRFKLLVQQASVGIIVLMGDDWVVTVVNEAYAKLLGRSVSEIIDRPLFEIIPEARAAFLPIIEKCRETGKSVVLNAEPYFVLNDGKEIRGYLNLVYQPFRESETSTSGVMVLCRDVSDLVHAKEKAESNQLRFENLIAESVIPTAFLEGPNMVLQMANKPMLNLWDRDKSIIGKPLLESIPELDGQSFPRILEQVYRSGETYRASDALVQLNRNGITENLFMDYSYKPLTEEGNVTGILVSAIDVTDRYLSKLRTDENAQNLKNTIMKAPVAMCLLKGSEHVVEIANEKMLELWGKTSQQMLNRPVFEGLTELEGQGFDLLLDNVFQTGETLIAEEVPLDLLRFGRQEVAYVNFVYEAFRNAQGEISGIMAVATEVTELIRSRQKIEDVVKERTLDLQEANRNLERSNRELAQFAYIASHDLQEPLRKISTFSQLLDSSLGSGNEKATRYTEKIRTAAARMSDLVRDVLSYSSLSQAGVLFTGTDLNSELQTVLEDLELRIDQKKATIKVDQLPSIVAIPLQMRQLFMNLISNALKFSSPERPPFISISCTKEQPTFHKTGSTLVPELTYYKIKVKDNGIGINPEYAEKIFNIFQRLHNKDLYEGTGIGLAICKKICVNHRGDIYCERTEEPGATFVIYLPEKQ